MERIDRLSAMEQETEEYMFMTQGALTGVKVLDLTRVLAGPYCGMIFADLGADVIKIEVPGRGDDSRAYAPQINGESAYYMNLNRNKRGITLNLKSDEGKGIFLQMVERADILLENFRPGTMEKLGLGYETLRTHNPGLIYGSVSGFGQTGPYSARPGYDIISQAMGGLMSTTGWPDGEPTRTGTAIGDVLGGLNMAIGVLAAYASRKETGRGQMVDVALVDSVVSALEIITQIYLQTGKVPARIGNRYESTYPYDSFRCKDCSIVIGCGNDKLFRALTALMGQSELAEDPRFCTNMRRVQNHAPLKAILEAWLAEQTGEEAVAAILGAGVPAAPINTIDQVVADPHIAGARQMFVEVDHPVAGKTRLTGCQIKLSDTEAGIRTPAPTLGQHTAEVLGELLGLTGDQVDGLRERGVV